MDRAQISKKQRARTAGEAVRAPLGLLLPLLGAVLFLLAFAPAASAFKEVSQAGEGAGQTSNPQGLAVDFETGRLYVADEHNLRIDVFDKTGAFLFAFGWGVKDASAKFQTCTAITTCRKGLSGAGKGQFSRPTDVAVDNDPASPSFHDVYVVDRENFRIEKFTPEGEFILTFGGGVNKTKALEGKTSEEDVCVEGSGDVCGAGSNGFGEGEFSSPRAIPVGVGPDGTVYVADSHFKNGVNEAEGEESRIQLFEPSGAFVVQHSLGLGDMAQMAVDSTGDFYVNTEGIGQAFSKYNSSAIEISSFPQNNTGSLAIDSSDDIFAGEGSVGFLNVVEYDSSGNPLRRFGYGTLKSGVSGLAPYHSASGDIYVSGGDKVIHVDFPPPGPVILPEPCKANPLGNSKATLDAEVNPEGKATTYHFEYVSDEAFQKDVAESGAGHGFDHAKRAPKLEGEDPALPGDFELHKASAQAELAPETKYHCRVVAANADAPSGVTGEEGTFTSLQPLEIGATFSSDVGTEAATLNAEVNPLGIPTTGYFQYVTEATYQEDIAELGPGHGFDHATKAPDVDASEEPIEFGAAEAFQVRSVELSELSPGTPYRYRILVTDDQIEPEVRAGPAEALRTFSPGEGGLPDNRAWELVSPAQKNSAEVAVPGTAGGLTTFFTYRPIQAAAGSGEAVTYTSWTSFGDPESAPATSQYLSKRTASGWGTENISPFGFERMLVPPYRGFSADLAFGAVVASEPPLTPEAQEGFENLYLRDNQTGQLQALMTEAPALDPGETHFFCTGYSGASTDGSRAFFAANGAMAGAPVGKGFSLYEHSPEGLELVSVLPDGAPAAPNARSAFGAGAPTSDPCSIGQGILRHAVSADGQTVFWTYGGNYVNGGGKTIERPLFARIEGKETIEIDAQQSGGAQGGRGAFWGASADGSKAIFTAPGKLLPAAKAEGQLYRYDTVARTLTDLTPGNIAPEVEGVIGASEDETYVYFIARRVLTAEEENAAGEKAVAGANNLYLYHEGEGLRFIGALSNRDEGAWSSAPATLTARVSPDGHELAFTSTEATKLTATKGVPGSGYDDTIASGAHCEPNDENKLSGDPHCAEAFLYDAEAKALDCVSCNPSGARPEGPTELPAWSNPFEGPRYLSEDGRRLFFESRDALSTADQDKKRDVYEFERAGTGSCSSESPDFDQSTGGCLLLVSSGKSADESYLLDASADGRDAFFSTRQSLTGWDTNENYDVYDARVGGGFPEPDTKPICEGEGCLPPPPSPPSVSSPATPHFEGPVNPKPKKPPKKHHRHRAKKQRQKKRGHAKAHRDGRAVR